MYDSILYNKTFHTRTKFQLNLCDGEMDRPCEPLVRRKHCGSARRGRLFIPTLHHSVPSHAKYEAHRMTIFNANAIIHEQRNCCPENDQIMPHPCQYGQPGKTGVSLNNFGNTSTKEQGKLQNLGVRVVNLRESTSTTHFSPRTRRP